MIFQSITNISLSDKSKLKFQALTKYAKCMAISMVFNSLLTII